ncbi:MAG: dTDP-4-dehydrorhamnose reductase [Patescibacteria group bacterium]
MKVLVIGARGMLGQAVMRTWSDLEPVGLDLPDLDITNPPQIARTLDLYQPTVVINCAAYTAVDDCESNELTANRVNGTAVGYLAKACTLRNVRLIHVSTDYVFDGNNANGYREDAPLAPINAYGRSKAKGEHEIVSNAHQYYLVRTSWLYGPGGNPKPLPDAWVRGQGNFVTTMLDLAKTKPELRVVNDQHGKPTYTRDLAVFMKQLALDHAPSGIYHGVNEGETTWYDFTRGIFRQTKITTPVRPCTSAEFPRPAKRPAYSTLLNTKRPLMRPWTEALGDYLIEIGYPVKG